METLQEFQPRLVYNNYKEHIKQSISKIKSGYS